MNFDSDIYDEVYNKLKDDAFSLKYVNDIREGAHFNDERLNKSSDNYEGKHFKSNEVLNYEGKHFSRPFGSHFKNSFEGNNLESVVPYVEFIKDGYGYIAGNFTSDYLNKNYKSLELEILNFGVNGVRLINDLSSEPKSVDGIDVSVRLLENGNIEVLGDVEHLKNHNFSIENVKESTSLIDTSTLEGIYNKIKDECVINDKDFLSKYLDNYLKISEKNEVNKKALENLYVMMTNKWLYNMAHLDISKISVTKDKSIEDYEIIKDFCLSNGEVHNLDEIFSLYENLNNKILSKNSNFYKNLIQENSKYGYKTDALYRYFGIKNIRLRTNGLAGLDKQDLSNIYIDKNNFGVFKANFGSDDYVLSVRSNVDGFSNFIESYISECEKNNVNYSISVDVRNFDIAFHVSKDDLVKNINILNNLATKNNSLVSGIGNINDYLAISSSASVKSDDILKMAASSLLEGYMKDGKFASKEEALADMKKSSNYLDNYLNEIRDVCDKNNVDFDTLCFKKGTLEEFLKLDSREEKVDNKDNSGLDIVPEDYLNNIKNTIAPRKVVSKNEHKRKVTRRQKPTLKERWKNLSTKKKALIIAGVIATIGVGVFVIGPQLMVGIGAILNSTGAQTDTVNQAVNLVNDTVTSAGASLDYSSIGEGHTVFSNAYDAASNVNGLVSNEWFSNNPIDVFNTETNSYMGLTQKQLNDPSFMAELAKDPNNALLLGNSMADPSGFVSLDEVVKGGISR